MKKFKWVFVLIALLLLALIGFFIYRKVEDNKTKYVEIKFIDGYNDQVLSTQELEVGKDANVPEVPKHEGCNFSGWYTSDKVKIENFTNIQKNITVYANCAKLTFNVKFYDTIGKKVVDRQKINYGESAEAPDAPEHYGYNFVRWKGNYSNVKSNVTVNAVYAAQKAKYVVKYYTLDDANKATLYTTKTFNSYVNRKVKASIMSIGGYKYDSNNSLNKLSGRVNIDNSLVLKVYYNSTSYIVSIDGDEKEYDYKDEITLPTLEKTVTLSYYENENVTNKLDPNVVDLTLLGYCKNSETCESDELIKPETKVIVTANADYYPVWNMDMELLLPTGENYELDGETYNFVSWLNSDDSEYLSGDAFTFTEDTILVATYKKGTTDSTDKVKYIVNVYYDDELHSSVTEYAEIGEEVFGSKYATELEDYDINSYTESIFISENTDENVIEVYYVSKDSTGDEPSVPSEPSGDEPGSGTGKEDEPSVPSEPSGDEPGSETGKEDEPSVPSEPSGDEPGSGTGKEDEPSVPSEPSGDEPGSGTGKEDEPSAPSEPSGDEPGSVTGKEDEPSAPSEPSGDEPGSETGKEDEPSAPSEPSGDEPGSGTGKEDEPSAPSEPSGDEPGSETGKEDEPSVPSEPSGDEPGSGTGKEDEPSAPSEPSGDEPGSGTGKEDEPSVPSEPSGGTNSNSNEGNTTNNQNDVAKDNTTNDKVSVSVDNELNDNEGN